MRKRLPYCIGFAFLLIIEFLIGAFVRDDFIRPYVGDLLVTVLLCCLGRIFFPDLFAWLPAAVFGFAVAVECAQLIDIPALEGTVLGIALGSTFDLKDIVCYGLGCLVFAAGEKLLRSKER